MNAIHAMPIRVKAIAALILVVLVSSIVAITPLLSSGHRFVVPAAPAAPPASPSTGRDAANASANPGIPQVLGGEIDRPGALHLAGTVGGLYPTATQPLAITLTNGGAVPLNVVDLVVTVGDANASCAASSLQVAPFTGSLLVPANGAAVTSVDVTMSPTADNSCQGAAFPLAYSGTAVAA